MAFSLAVSVGFNPTEYMVLEGGSVQLTIERTGDAEEPVVVSVTTSDGNTTGRVHNLFFHLRCLQGNTDSNISCVIMCTVGAEAQCSGYVVYGLGSVAAV